MMELNEMAIYTLIDEADVKRFCLICDSQGVDFANLLPFCNWGFIRRMKAKKKELRYDSGLILFVTVKSNKVIIHNSMEAAMGGDEND